MLEHTPCYLISSSKRLGLNYSELCNMDTEGILGTCFARREDSLECMCRAKWRIL